MAKRDIRLFPWQHLGLIPEITEMDPSYNRYCDATIRTTASLVFIIFTILLGIFSIFLDRQELDLIEKVNWFQRSGAILVAASVILEWNVTKYRTARFPDTCIPMRMVEKNLKIFAFVFLLIGTLIWAYGDLVLCWTFNLLQRF